MSTETHDEPNCDPSVQCKFVGPRDCPCRCHDGAYLLDLPERPSVASLLHGTEFDGMFRPELRVVE